MKDLIERQKAIDALKDWYDGLIISSFRGVEKVIKALPSAQPAPQWISISEGLPKIDESVLVTTDWDDLSIAWRTGVDEWYIHEGNTNSTTDDITAWMPLPKPYRAERRTDE